MDLDNVKIPDENELLENLNEDIDEESLLKIGRRGEKWVYAYLKSLHHDRKNISIKWLNEEGEKGLPYDIQINFVDKSQDIQRIEVKTTSKNMDNYRFPISIQEVKEMLQYPETYYIYRVNLMTRSLTIIDNLVQNLSGTRQLQLQMNVLKPADKSNEQTN